MEMLRNRKGFTLIEILVVVAIVAVLSAIVVVGLGPARRQGRDARRITDIKQVQAALELYYNRYGHYPDSVALTPVDSNYAKPDPVTTPCTTPIVPPADGGVAGGAGWGAVQGELICAGVSISAVADDPSPAQHYIYDTVGKTADTYPAKYILGAQLEDAGNPALTGSGDLDNAQGDDSMGCGDANNPIYCISSG